MDEQWRAALVDEARALGVEVSPAAAATMAAHVDVLLTWNRKINLTRIVEPTEVRVKHCLDSLGALPVVPASAVDVIDMGAGAGFPGIPWMAARPALRVTMVDTVAKKVGFLKAVLAQLKLGGGRGVHARLEGKPEAEGLFAADVVVSRAFMDLERVLRLARFYLRPSGCVVAMLGPRETVEAARTIAAAATYEIEEERSFSLPHGAGERRVLRLVPRGTP